MQYSVVNYKTVKENSDFRIDTEYFHPLYLKLDQEFLNYDTKAIGEFAYVTDGEHGAVELKNDGIKYLMGENIKEGFVNLKNIRYVDKSVHIRNKRASVEVGNILISIKGSLGDIAIVEKGLLPANMSRDVAIIKIKDPNIFSEYVCIYLMSNIGKTLAIREGSGGVQQMITLGRLRNIKVPILSDKLQKTFKRMYDKSLYLREYSKTLYSQAEQLLLSELGLLDWKPKHEIAFVKNFSDTQEAERFDAEFFQPKYEQIVEAMKKYKGGFVELREVAKTKRGSLISDSFYSEKKGTPYIRGADFSSGFLRNDKLVFINNFFSSKTETKIKKDDIVFALIGTVGSTALVDDNFSGAFISNNLGKITSKAYNPTVLQVLLHSVVGKLYFEKEQTQTAQPKISDKDIHKFILPKLENKTEKEIEKKYIESQKNKKLSKSLLEIAKRGMEMAIEKDESEAERWIEEKMISSTYTTK
jgi:restriction endonuclease S subunit